MSGPVEIPVAVVSPPAADLSTVDGARVHLQHLHDIYLTPKPYNWCARQCVDPALNIMEGFTTQADHIVVESKTEAGNHRRLWQIILTVDPIKLAAAVKAVRSPVLGDGFIVLEILNTTRAGDLSLRKIYEVAGVTGVNVARIEKRLVTHAKDGNPIMGKTERGLMQHVRNYEVTGTIDWKEFRVDMRWLGKGPSRRYWRGEDDLVVETMVVTNAVPFLKDGSIISFHGHASRWIQTGERTFTEDKGTIYETSLHDRHFERLMVQSYEGIWLPVLNWEKPADTPKLYEAALQFDRDAAAFVPDEDMEALAMLA